MPLFDIRLKRGPRFFGTPTVARHIRTAQPQVEILEERQCPSVAAPTGLTLTALSSTQVKLTWINPVGSLGTDIYTWNGSSSVLLAQVAKGITTYTASNLTPDTTQWFAVDAFDSSTNAESAWASVATLPQEITAPTNLHVASATQTSVTLGWTNGTGEVGYRVYGWTGTTSVLVGATTPSTPAFTVTGLAAGVNYYFYVQAYNATNSASTAWVSAATAGTSLAAPTNLKASALGTTSIALSWSKSANNTGYRIYEWNGSSFNSPVLIATLAANTTGYQAVGLAAGQTYWFYVQAYNAVASANTAWISAATTSAPTLQAPTNVTATAEGTSSALLSWTASAAASGYRIYVWTGRSWSAVASVAAGATQYTVTGLTDTQSNWLLVEAYNSAATAYSNAVLVNL